MNNVREEQVGKFSINMDTVSDNDNIFAEDISVNPELLKENIKKEKKRQESWVGKGILPFGFNIMIEPYAKNPYLKQYDEETGFSAFDGTFKNSDSGKVETLDLSITCAKVVEVGPDVKHIKRGDEVIYSAIRALPVPFMNKGFLLINEGHVTAIINDNSELEARFPHLA